MKVGWTEKEVFEDLISAAKAISDGLCFNREEIMETYGMSKSAYHRVLRKLVKSKFVELIYHSRYVKKIRFVKK